MKLSDTTNFLYANVDEWCYATDCPCPGDLAGQSESMLRISGTTRLPFADLAHPLPVELCLLNEALGEDSEMYGPWQLDLLDDLHCYGIATMLEGLVTLPRDLFAELKGALLRAARLPGYTVQFRMETRELLGRDVAEGEGRRFALTLFGFDLKYQRGGA